MKNKFKFKIGDLVFILGRNGISKVNATGVFTFANGSTLNMYQIIGAHNNIVPEHTLLSFNEEKQLMRDSEL
jgi:hypothetical protein